MEEKLNEFMVKINERLDHFQRQIDRSGHYGDNFQRHGSNNKTWQERPIDDRNYVAAGSALQSASGPVADVQGEYAALRDSLSSIKVPAELKLNESRQGIKRSDQPVFNILTKCSRYNETIIKLLSTITPEAPVTQEKLDQWFLACNAQCKYLQDEYASIVVSGQFDPSTARIFRALQKNTTGLGPDSLNTLRSAAALSAATNNHQRGTNTQSNPSRGRGGRGNYFRQDYQRDAFRPFAQRSFPNRRYQREDNSGGMNDVSE